MLKSFNLLFFSIILFFVSQSARADITLNELLFKKDQPLHLKILTTLPNEAKIEYGPQNAENTIIEFMDYFCGYCKKIHPDLLKIAEERNDVRVIFLQHPILSESSKLLAEIVIAANFQNKGLDLHNSIFSISGSITQKKLEDSIKKSEINSAQLNIDRGRPEIDQMIQLSSFLAGGIGARGTPTFFINEEFIGGFISKQQIISLLK
jgi:protein-disulfide isomerase